MLGATEQEIEIADPISGEWGRAYVTLRPVKLPLLDEVIGLDGADGARKREGMARGLAFGTDTAVPHAGVARSSSARVASTMS